MRHPVGCPIASEHLWSTEVVLGRPVRWSCSQVERPAIGRLAGTKAKEFHMPSPQPTGQSRSSTSINGIPIPELLRGATTSLGAQGEFFEAEHKGFVCLGNGEVVSDPTGLARCDPCAAEAVMLSASGALSPATSLVSALYRKDQLKHSSVSGAALCPRHQRVIPLPDGRVIVVSPAEAAQLQAVPRPWYKRILDLFVVRDGQ
jgi:hypothetical protein